MDSRITLGMNESFVEILNRAYATGEEVAMLIDDNGLERMEGVLAAVSFTGPAPYIEMDNGSRVNLQKIVAINGIFLPEYSGC
jgi:hypothetical protein